MKELMISLFSVIIGFIISLSAAFQTIKKQKTPFITLGIGILISTLSIPFLINELYKIGIRIGKGYYTLWEANDVLSFYGSFLAFLGTIALGGLALWQNHKLLELDNSREKEKLFEIYFSYLDETQKLFDPIYIIGKPEENRSELDFYSIIKSCHLSILRKKRRLFFLDKTNSDNNFFQYIEDRTNEMTRITIMKEDDKQEVTSLLYKFWKKNAEEYNSKSLIFMMEIYKSIFGEEKPQH